MSRFVEGSDDTFMVMMFAFVASICCLLVLEFLFKYRQYVYDFKCTAAWIKDVIRLSTTDRNKMKIGYELLKENDAYTKKYIVPMWRRILGRWRWVCWIACLFLFTAVAYQKLSFDPYEILGVKPDASMSEIKKAYRLLSKNLHPDINKTAEAVPLYAKVVKAYKVLKNPDDKEAFNDGESHKQGVALPPILTNPDYAMYSVTALLLVLFSAPFYLLTWLNNKSQTQNFIPAMTNIAKNIAMAEPFFKRFGEPRNLDREYEVQQRPKLVATLKKMEVAGCFETPRDEVPISPSVIAESFHPEVASVADLAMLMDDVINGKNSRESENRLRDSGIFLNKELPHILQKYLPECTEEEKAEAKAYRERRSKGTSRVDDLVFEVPNEEETQVAMYFLEPLLNQILAEVSALYPRQDARPEFAKKLKNIYLARLDHLKHLKKLASERQSNTIDASNKQQRELLAKALDNQIQTDKFAFELITEMRLRFKSQMKAYYERVGKMQKKEKSAKKKGKGGYDS